MRWLKLLFKIILILVLLVVTLVASIATFVDPSNYKQEISQLLQRQTGRTCTIKGAIQWSMSPEVALYVENISLGNSPKFQGAFFEAKEAHFKISFRDLLVGQLAFKGVEINGLKLYLTTTLAGKNNWDDLINRPKSRVTKKAISDEKADEVVNAKKNNQLRIAHVTLKDANIYWEDHKSATHFVIMDMSLRAKGLDFNQYDTPPPMKVKGSIRDLTEKYATTLNFSGKVFQQDKNTVLFDNLELGLAKAVFKGRAKLTALKTNPVLNANLVTDNVNPKKLLVSLEKKHDNLALPEKISGSVDFKVSSKQLDLSKLDLKVDNGNLSSEGKVVFADPASSTAKLHLENLDVKLLENFLESLLEPSHKGIAAIADSEETNIAEVESTAPQGVTYPLGKLSVTANDINYDKHAITKLQTEALLVKSNATLEPLNISYLQGYFPLKLEFDSSNKNLQFETLETCSFPVSNVFKEFKLNNSLSGSGSFTGKLSTNIADVATSRRKLTGNFDFRIKDGRYVGIDIIQILKKVEADLGNLQSLLNDNQNFNFKGLVKTNTKDWRRGQSKNAFTDFSKLRVYGDIKNGVTNNLKIFTNAPGFEISGGGSVNVVTEALNLRLQIKRKLAFKGRKDLGRQLHGKTLALKVTGTMSNPVIEPDIDHYMEQVLQELHKQMLKQALDKMLGGSDSNSGIDVKEGLMNILGR